MASITVRPVSGLKMRARRLLMPQSREPDPLRKNPWLGGGTSVWKFLASPSASGMSAAPGRPGGHPFEEGEGIGGEVLFVVEQRPPDLGGRGQVGQEVSKGLDRQPSVVGHVAERLEGRLPGDAAAARHAAVVLGDMDVSDASSRPPDRGGRIFLLYVRMEGVEMDAAVGVADLVDQADGLVEDVEVVDLKTVHDLLGEDHPGPLRVFGNFAQVFDTAVPLFIGGAATGEHAERDLVRAAQDR